ncbi:MAG: bifunctional UDP-sugar hydrolase/5'-nucleotidase, partial [Bacillota bacterium]|nr:bifunctional UDP-sugar hydrolase/5'-nucleotidase [Bacillota bacterium]
MATEKDLIILHSNDLHGDFLAEEVDENLIGGVSRLSGYINKVRDENENSLYAVAGDMFRGSVIDSEFQGMSTIEIMNLLGPDVVSLGNHEVDYGIAHLIFLERCAKFPIVNANLYIKTTGQRLFNAYKILRVGGMTVMFIGILTESIMDRAKMDQLLGSFVDVAEAAQEVGKICNAHKKVDVDLTVLLTHIGFEEDKQLAALLDPGWGVDIIIGGHSHTLPEEPAKVNGVLIVQAGTGTDQIGRFDIKVDTDTNSVASYSWRTVPIDEDHCPRDTALEAVLKKYKTVTDKKYGRILTHLTRQLTHPERTQETEMGNLFSDILQEELGVDIMFLGSGSVRLEQMGPILEFGELVEVYPYDDAVYHLQVTGAQLRKMFLH